MSRETKLIFFAFMGAVTTALFLGVSIAQSAHKANPVCTVQEAHYE